MFKMKRSIYRHIYMTNSNSVSNESLCLRNHVTFAYDENHLNRVHVCFHFSSIEDSRKNDVLVYLLDN